MLPASGVHANSASQLRCGWGSVGGLILASLIGNAAFAADRMAGAALPAAEAQQIAPMALRLDDATGTALRIDLSPATAPAPARKGRGPLRIGIHREMPPGSRGDLLPRLNWMPVGNGAVAAAVLVSSPEATSIRVGVTAELPAGAELRFFQPNGDVLAVVGLEDLVRAEDEIFWSPSADGDVLGFEITLPARTAIGTSSLRVGKVAHRFLDPRSTRFKSLECPDLHIDVQCRVGEFPSGLENAVARLDFETDRGSAMCSGTLLNDGDEDTFIPYFLTANHCLATAEEARTVQATWFHQRTSCETEAVDPRANTTFGGADIVATSEQYDATLLRLRRRLPAGVFFSGWDAQEVLAADAVVGIHHPAGVVKKYSAGEVAGKQDTDSVVGAIEVLWDEGVTEGGSSGSAIFRDGRAIGTLSHGNVCTSGIYRDFYGPFAHFYPQVCSALNPGTGCGDGAHDVPLAARAIAAGATATDAIDEAGDVDYWRIAVPSYGTLIVETTGDADTVGTLESENGAVLATDDDGGAGGNFRIERVLERGTYYVRVTGGGDGVGDYALRVDHMPVPIDALPAAAWEDGTVASIADPYEVDYWRIEVLAGAAIVLFTSGSADTVGALESTAGEPLADDDDGGSGLNFRIDALLPAGVYRLKVSGYREQTGLYTLHARQTPLTEISAVAEDGSTGEIAAANEKNYWRIDVPSPSVSTLETTGPTDTIGRLFTAAGEQTAADDDGGDGTNFRIERILAAGTFYARVRAYQALTGSYTMMASHAALAADDLLELSANTRGTGNIGEAEAEDIWRFALPEATVVTVESSGNLDTFGTLEDGFGRARSDDDSGPGANFRITSELPAGTHYVRVSGVDAATGDYALHLRTHLDVDVGDMPETAAPLPIDAVQDSVIRPIGDVDYWRLEVPSLGILQVESEGATDVLAALQDARGGLLAEDDDSGFVRNFLLAHPVFPGTYFLRVSGYSTATGAYALRATHARSPISIPWFLAARNTAQGREGFARLINLSEQAGTVRIHAIDDAGANAGAIDIALQASETVHFNSDDLERGNAAKGIAAGIGTGVGDWRLVLETELDLNALTYVRTSQGFLTNMHDVVPPRETQGSSNNRYVVPIFNPASNRRQVSKLRLFNLGDERAAITIAGLDDNGNPAPGGGVSLSLDPAAARTLTAQALETGGNDFDGSLGDGRGKWELAIGSTERLGVMNLLESLPAAGDADAPGGNLTNLSTGSPLPAIMPDAHPCTPCEVPLFIAADDPLRQGFVRLSNHSPYLGRVTIHAIDDAGQRFGPVTVAINAGATVHFNSDDLERGNPAKGLSGGIGDGVGDWRLEVRTALDVVGPLAYARTRDGFLTSLHDLVRGHGGAPLRYRVPIFNPASNRDQRSQLRIVNPTPHDAAVSIAGVDDRGQPGPRGEVSFTLPAGQSRTIDAEQLELGHGELNGRLGDGSGKWQLLIEADQPLRVLNLLLSANGNLTNLSSSPQR